MLWSCVLWSPEWEAWMERKWSSLQNSNHPLSLLHSLSPHPPHGGPPVLWTLVPLLLFHPGLGGNNTTISGKKVQRRKCIGAGWRGSGFDLLRRHGYGVRVPLCSLPLHLPWPLISGVLAVQISRRRMLESSFSTPSGTFTHCAQSLAGLCKLCLGGNEVLLILGCFQASWTTKNWEGEWIFYKRP